MSESLLDWNHAVANATQHPAEGNATWAMRTRAARLHRLMMRLEDLYAGGPR